MPCSSEQQRSSNRPRRTTHDASHILSSLARFRNNKSYHGIARRCIFRLLLIRRTWRQSTLSSRARSKSIIYLFLDTYSVIAQTAAGTRKAALHRRFESLPYASIRLHVPHSCVRDGPTISNILGSRPAGTMPILLHGDAAFSGQVLAHLCKKMSTSCKA